MAGGGGYSAMMINFVVRNPVLVYCTGGFTLLGLRKFETAKNYNLWFGKQHFQRKLSKGAI